MTFAKFLKHLFYRTTQATASVINYVNLILDLTFYALLNYLTLPKLFLTLNKYTSINDINVVHSELN